MNTEYWWQSDYRTMLDRQTREFNRRVLLRKRGALLPSDLLLINEHLPVYTLGRHGKSENLLVNENMLKAAGIDFVKIGRGGDITYHGPGQLTVYPILDMQRYKLGVKDYIWLLEESVIRTIAGYGVQGERIEGATGVWVGKGTRQERKISAIGIKCSRFVCMHGLSLNIGMDLTGFYRINPCGFIDRGVTSLSKETGREIDIRKVGEKLADNIRSLLRLRILSQGNS